MRGFFLIFVIPLLLTIISIPVLSMLTCRGFGVGGLGCLVELMFSTIIAWVVFMFIGITLNCYLKKKNK